MRVFGWLDRLTLRLFLAQGADVATFLCFYLLVGPQVHAERNPLILGLMALGGLAAVGLFKMLITLIVIYRYRRSPGTIRHARARAAWIAGAAGRATRVRSGATSTGSSRRYRSRAASRSSFSSTPASTAISTGSPWSASRSSGR